MNAAPTTKKGVNSADVYTENSEQTPLYQACYNGHESIARLLVESGVDVNATSKGEQTALHQACYNGHESIARLLVERGA
jgi:ankyrin repeat protein